MRSEREAHNLRTNDYSNGYRYRKMYGSGKLLELKVPRTRSGGFHPIILELLKDQEAEARELAFSLYGHGLTTQDVGLIFERLYGKNYSTSQVSRMFEFARQEVEEWRNRPLEPYYPIVYIDATFISVRRGGNCLKEAFYTMLGVRPDMTHEVIAVVNNPTESASFWRDILTLQKERGLREVGLFCERWSFRHRERPAGALSQSGSPAVHGAFPKGVCQVCKAPGQSAFLRGTEFCLPKRGRRHP